MDERADLIERFVRAAGWDQAGVVPMTGDASARRYLRLHGPTGHSAVLMDAPPANGQDIRSFVQVGHFLAENGFSAPEVLAADEWAGLLLLEDFGDHVFARLMESDPHRVAPLYEAAVDMLIELARVPPPADLICLGARQLTAMTEPCLDWYASAMGRPASVTERQELFAILEACLQRVLPGANAFSLRDCHAENLIWLPSRTGIRRVGLLDYQDAVVVHPAYDLVSLLQDARRDVPDDLADAMFRRFADAGDWDRDSFGAAYAGLGLQRNLRILGIFVRLAVKDGKTQYLSLIPRVWAHVERNLRHPEMTGIAARLRAVVPAPTDKALEGLAAHVIA